MSKVFLFDKTTNMAKPWAEAGYDCYCIDMQHEPGFHRAGNIVKVGVDVLLHDGWRRRVPPVDGLFAFPPCTDVAVSGARWMRSKGIGAVINALRLFQIAIDCAEEWDCPYMLENPVSTVSTYWRPPDFKFNPNDYGDPYTKETWLWTGNGFVMPPIIQRGDLFNKPTVAEGPIDHKRIHYAPPSRFNPQERANFRSETPMGFARAVFAANHNPEFDGTRQQR